LDFTDDAVMILMNDSALIQTLTDSVASWTRISKHNVEKTNIMKIGR